MIGNADVPFPGIGPVVPIHDWNQPVRIPDVTV
jgi:hypothetical protein